jgi:hypothetical protein
VSPWLIERSRADTSKSCLVSLPESFLDAAYQNRDQAWRSLKGNPQITERSIDDLQGE